MRYPHLSARIFNTPLLIHPQKLDAIIAGLGGRLTGLTAENFNTQNLIAEGMLPPEMFSTKRGERNQERGYQVIDGVAVININGATVHRSRIEAMSTFLLGYDDITASIEHAMNNSDVHAVLRVYDSPGGEVQGAFEHADRLNALIGKKPMVSIADGMAASAAYLGGSAADELVITNTGYAGSIGVVMRHLDVSRAMANEGVQVTHIYAGSHKIDGNPFAPLPEAVRADFQLEIDELYDMFVQAIAKQRAISADSIRNTEAAIYRGEQAVAAGLADRVSTTDAIIEELASKRSTRIHSISSATSAATNSKNANLSGVHQASTEPTNSTKGVSTMKLEELRLAHPDLCAALVEEGHRAGFEAGANAELNRIKSVEAQSMNGHEALITTLKFDGKTTGPEAAVQVLSAEKSLQNQAAAAVVSNAPAALTFAAAPDDAANAAATAEAEANLPIEEKAKAEWDASPQIRAEFGGNLSTYTAFRNAQNSGRVKVAHKKD
jgi:signal peptide peptidase SppA